MAKKKKTPKMTPAEIQKQIASLLAQAKKLGYKEEQKGIPDNKTRNEYREQGLVEGTKRVNAKYSAPGTPDGPGGMQRTPSTSGRLVGTSGEAPGGAITGQTAYAGNGAIDGDTGRDLTNADHYKGALQTNADHYKAPMQRDPRLTDDDRGGGGGPDDTLDYYTALGHPEWDPSVGGQYSPGDRYLPRNLTQMEEGTFYRSGLSIADTKKLGDALAANGYRVEVITGPGATPGLKLVTNMDPGAAPGDIAWPVTTVPGRENTYYSDDFDNFNDAQIASLEPGYTIMDRPPGGSSDGAITADGGLGTEPRFQLPSSSAFTKFLNERFGDAHMAPEEQVQAYLQSLGLDLANQSMEDNYNIAIALFGLEEKKVDMAGDLNDAQIAILDSQREIADMSIEEYKTYGGPKVAEFLSKGPESLDYAAERAVGGIQQQYESGMAQEKRRLEGLGVDPSSPQYQSFLAEGYGPALAAAKVGAMTKARDNQRASNLGLLTDQANLARGQQATGIGALSAAASNAGSGVGLLSNTGSATAAAGGALTTGAAAGTGALNTGMGMAGDWMSNYLSSQQLMQSADDGGSGFSIGLGGEESPFRFGINL